MSRSKPAKVFKYEPWSDRSLSNLRERILFFGSPANFNDPYDCNIRPRISPFTQEGLDSLRSYYLTKPDLPAEMRSGDMLKDYLRNNFGRIARDKLHVVVQALLEDRGISCFCEENDSLLMWSHYATNHQGFCLEFCTLKEPFSRLLAVDYTNVVPEIDAIKMHTEPVGGDDQLHALFLTKAKSWEYEKEWRILHKVAKTKYTYSPEVLSNVYLGAESSEAAAVSIREALDIAGSKAKMWKGVRSDTEFRIVFKEIV